MTAPAPGGDRRLSGEAHQVRCHKARRRHDRQLRTAQPRTSKADGIDDDAPPYGTAIVRPLRHVRAVRDHHASQFADPVEAAVSRSARAWTWALGETPTAPVTDRPTAVPPSRSKIESEIAAADERRLRGDRENRADAAATILRWLIGDDDHIPVRGEDPGELVGGFGDVVRTPEQIADVLALAEGQRRAQARKRDAGTDLDDRSFARQDADYWTVSWRRSAGSSATDPRPRSLTRTLAN